MKGRSKRWLSGLSVVVCLFLVAGAASADRYKHHGKGKGNYKSRHYDQRYSGHRCDGWHYGGRYEDYRGGSSYRGSNSGWSVGGHWEGAHGGISGHVYGGQQRYPGRSRYYSGYRSSRDCGGGHYYGGGHYRPHHRPVGHLPPPGTCRVWFHDRPAGHQPPPTSCREAEHFAYHHGGEVIYGGPHH